MKGLNEIVIIDAVYNTLKGAWEITSPDEGILDGDAISMRLHTEELADVLYHAITGIESRATDGFLEFLFDSFEDNMTAEDFYVEYKMAKEETW